MNRATGPTRREFFKTTTVAGGGLMIGFFLPTKGRRAQAAAPARKPFVPNSFVRIEGTGAITVMVNHSEMGQGIYTALAMLVAEDLDADWSKIKVESAPVDPAYNHTLFGLQLTGGSTSTHSEWQRFRQAGAAARAMLVEAAAATWQIDAATCRTESGFVFHPDGVQRFSYGALASRAATMTPPEKVELKKEEDFRIIGKRVKRLDTPEKIDGTGVFGIDVDIEGMLIAVVARPPVFGAELKSFQGQAALDVDGVKHVVEIDRGIAVVADSYWSALRGRRALEVAWDPGPLAELDSTEQRDQYAELAGQAGAAAISDGNVDAVLAAAEERIEATYELPYLAHAAMEPLNCVADVRADGCDVWTGTQSQTIDFGAIAQITGLAPQSIRLHTTLLGGGFGRRAVLDSHFVREAVQISKALKTPIKVIWSREDDTKGGYYRPASTHTLAAALDGDGRPLAWRHRIACQSFIVGTPFESGMIQNGVDRTAVEGAAELPYAMANLRVEWKQAPIGVPTLWWRSVGHSHNGFVVESFIDELAHKAGQDPFEYRRQLMADHPRDLRVLELAAEKAGWGKPLPEGRGRGIAVHASFGSFVAQVAEVSLHRNGSLRVHRVVCAVDCGPIVNPDTIEAQMESGIVFGLSAAIYGEITFAKGRVEQRNFYDYKVLRMDEMPAVDVYIVPSSESMGGVGEIGLPPIAPAIANAVFAVSGKRIRRLPLGDTDLRV